MRVASGLRASAILLILGIVALDEKSSAQVDPSLGTWNLNLAKSKYDPGPAPKSNTVTIEAAGQSFKVSTKGVDAAGNPTGVTGTRPATTARTFP